MGLSQSVECQALIDIKHNVFAFSAKVQPTAVYTLIQNNA